MKKEKIHGYTLASKSKRFFATLLEGVLFTVLLLLIYLLLGFTFSEFWAEMDKDFEWMDLVNSLLTGLVIGGIFYPLFTGNLGHKIFDLKVISVETGEDYKKAEQGILRECLKHLLGYLIISIIWIFWDDKNQNLYDKITKTVVVEK